MAFSDIATQQMSECVKNGDDNVY